MKKWIVSIPVNASAQYTISAETKEEAINKAYEEIGLPCLCHQCANDVEIEDWADDGDPIVEEI